jgi:hypothetical protein
MARFVLAGALVAGACGSATDDRPATLEYITEAILAPSCATAGCHSLFRQQVGDAFDTPASTRRTIAGNGLVLYPEDIGDPSQSLLIRTLTVGAPSILDPGSGNVRMPYDAPLPDADIALIETWIASGLPGAQCVANDAGLGCGRRTISIADQEVTEFSVVACPDGNIGDVVEICRLDQICSYHTGNGRCTP